MVVFENEIEGKHELSVQGPQALEVDFLAGALTQAKLLSDGYYYIADGEGVRLSVRYRESGIL